MDPHAALAFARCAIEDDDSNEAENLMDSYVNWRGIGGFEPMMDGIQGDSYFDDLIVQYERTFQRTYLGARLP